MLRSPPADATANPPIFPSPPSIGSVQRNHRASRGRMQDLTARREARVRHRSGLRRRAIKTKPRRGRTRVSRVSDTGKAPLGERRVRAAGVASRRRRRRRASPARKRGLRRGEARERDAVGRARDVVEPERVAEGDRARLASVLAADAELELGRSAARPRSTAIRIRAPTPVDVEHLERVALDHAVLEVAREELALGVVAREAERRLGEVVRAEGEEVGVLGDLVRRACTRAAARSSSRRCARARAPPRPRPARSARAGGGAPRRSRRAGA